MRKADKEKKLTVLGKETVFGGFLKFTEDLHIQGSFSGAIDAQGFLLIEKTAECRVQYIRAASIIVEGTVYGSLTAADKIEMKPGCVIRGDVRAARIKIADGVSFEGAVQMLRDTSGIEENIFSTHPNQLKQKLRT
jgi:Integral membrane protein CcmA involved in cell shape determination|nr:polymer-forming cytoskeletal protein [uncultured Treponema sp.]